MVSIYPKRVPYASRKIYGVDIEASGLKAGFHEVIEIAIVPHHRGSGSSETPFVRRFKMQYPERAQREALAISRYNEEDWADASSFKGSWGEIKNKIEGTTLIGHNLALFDIPMIKGQVSMIGLEGEFESIRLDVIDTMALARVFLVPEGLKSLSLKACRSFFGKEYTGAHAAHEDAEMTLELYEDICSRIKYHGKPRQETLF